MNPDRYAMHRDHCAALIRTMPPEQRDWLALEVLLLEVVLADTLRDPQYRDQVMAVISDLAPSYATQLKRASGASRLHLNQKEIA